MATIIIVIYPHPLMAGFYPCLFAIQLAPLISEEFPISFESIHPYLYYISSFLALYFPMTFVSSTTLTLWPPIFSGTTPPLLVTLTVVITLVISQVYFMMHFKEFRMERNMEDWRWWGAMELARRFLLLLFTLPFPGNPIPPSYLLMAYLCAYAFIQPYKSAVVNLVEVALCVDLLVMLLIVGDSAHHRRPALLPHHTAPVSQSNQDGCVVSGFTRFTGLLTPFYYLPLLAGVVCIAVGVALLLRSLKGKFKDVDLSQRGGTEDASQRERINSDPFFISNSLQTNSRTTISWEDVDNRGREISEQPLTCNYVEVEPSQISNSKQ
eukprot:Em0015g818a